MVKSFFARVLVGGGGLGVDCQDSEGIDLPLPPPTYKTDAKWLHLDVTT